MLFDRKKPKKVESRHIPIPIEHTRRIMELIRDYQLAPHNARSWELYILWDAIKEIVPETELGDYLITLQCNRLILIELIGDDTWL